MKIWPDAVDGLMTWRGPRRRETWGIPYGVIGVAESNLLEGLIREDHVVTSTVRTALFADITSNRFNFLSALSVGGWLLFSGGWSVVFIF